MPPLPARGCAIKPLNELTATEIVAAIGARHRDLRGGDARLPRPHRRARAAGAGLGAISIPERGARRGPRASTAAAGAARSPACRSASRTSSTPSTCRPSGARRSTRAASRERDAACVALSRKAGGVLLGKTVTTEFANLHPGPTRNPHDLDPHARRLVERLGRRGRRLHGADRHRHPDHRLDHPARRRSAACSATARPTASTACTASWRPPARSTRSASWRARSPTSRSTATCCSASRPSRCRTIAAAAFRALPQPRLGPVRAGDPHADRGRGASAGARRRPRHRAHPARRIRAAQRRAPLDLELRVRPQLHVGDREPLGRDQRHACAAAGCTTASTAASSATSRPSSSPTNAAGGSTR